MRGKFRVFVKGGSWAIKNWIAATHESKWRGPFYKWEKGWKTFEGKLNRGRMERGRTKRVRGHPQSISSQTIDVDNFWRPNLGQIGPTKPTPLWRQLWPPGFLFSSLTPQFIVCFTGWTTPYYLNKPLRTKKIYALEISGGTQSAEQLLFVCKALSQKRAGLNTNKMNVKLKRKILFVEECQALWRE